MAEEKNQSSSVLGKLSAQSSGEQNPVTSTANAGPVDTGADKNQIAPIIEQDGSLGGRVETSKDALLTPSALADSADVSIGKAKAISTKERRVLPMSEEEAIARESGEIVVDANPFAAYKHRAVRHFKVGDFEFKNHILYLMSEEANERFLDVFEQLPERDRNEIVVYDFEAAKRVETPVAVSRGSMSTGQLKDPKVVQA